jgi:hypothetical protein
MEGGRASNSHACNLADGRSGVAERLPRKVNRLNRENADEGYKISLRYRAAAYSNHTSIAALLETLDEKMREQRYEQPTGEVISI